MLKLSTTYEQYLAATEKKGRLAKLLTNPRGSKLLLVDTAMERYSEHYDTAKYNMRMALTAAVAQECVRWIDAKASRNTRLKGKDELHQRRHRVVEKLLAESQDCLTALMKAMKAFEDRKTSAKRSGVDLNARSKGLATGFAHERADYEAGSKASNPIAATAVSGIWRTEFEAADGSIETYLRDVRTNGMVVNATDEALIRKVFASDFASISYGDYQSLARVYSTGKVEYLKKIDRLEYLAFIKGGCLEDARGEPIDSGGHLSAYAADQYGNIFVEFGGFHAQNHSTFNAGKAVLCAGSMKIERGKLAEVDNSSGHYQPSRADLHNLVSFLDEESLDLDETVVTVFIDPTHSASYKASTFLQNMNAVPDR